MQQQSALVANQAGLLATFKLALIVAFIGFLWQQFANQHNKEHSANCMQPPPQVYKVVNFMNHGGFLRGSPVQRQLIERGRDTATAQRLWQISEQLTGVQYQWSEQSRWYG